MSKHILAALGAASLAVCAQAQTVSSTLPGVVILGKAYDLTFTQSVNAGTSFNQVFGAGPATLTFDAASARAAATEVLAAVNAAGFDITPGTNDPSPVAFHLPFAATDTVFSFYVGWADTPGNAFAGVFGPTLDRSRTTLRGGSFVTFTSAVPEPSAALLALAGVGVVVWARRRAPGPRGRSS
jgi:PEP-CTERM motif